MRRITVALILFASALSPAFAGNDTRDFCKNPTPQERAHEALMAECRALEEARKHSDFFRYFTQQIQQWRDVIHRHVGAGASVGERRLFNAPAGTPGHLRNELLRGAPSSPVEEQNRTPRQR